MEVSVSTKSRSISGKSGHSGKGHPQRKNFPQTSLCGCNKTRGKPPPLPFLFMEAIFQRGSHNLITKLAHENTAVAFQEPYLKMGRKDQRGNCPAQKKKKKANPNSHFKKTRAKGSKSSTRASPHKAAPSEAPSTQSALHPATQRVPPSRRQRTHRTERVPDGRLPAAGDTSASRPLPPRRTERPDHHPKARISRHTKRFPPPTPPTGRAHPRTPTGPSTQGVHRPAENELLARLAPPAPAALSRPKQGNRESPYRAGPATPSEVSSRGAPRRTAPAPGPAPPGRRPALTSSPPPPPSLTGAPAPRAAAAPPRPASRPRPPPAGRRRPAAPRRSSASGPARPRRPA